MSYFFHQLISIAFHFFSMGQSIFTWSSNIWYLSVCPQYNMKLPGTLSSPKKKKNNIHLEKKSLYFRKWNFLALIFKKFFYFGKWNPALSGLNHQNFSLKNFLYFFLKKPTLKKILIFYQKKAFPIFPEMELCTFHPKFWK